jgi:CubicO group peptidase (beta-lactamase class C family)
MDLDSAVRLVDDRVAAFRAEAELPGVSYALLKDGDVVHLAGAGTTVLDAGSQPDADTVFRIASMTKSVTASAVLLLRDRGALRLDDRLDEHLPGTSSLRAAVDGHPIELRDLLTMTAGFPTDDPWGDRQEDLPLAAFDELVAGGLSFAAVPRTAWEYSNLGYALLGRVISAATGRDYREYVRTELLEPLGMTSTGYDVGDVPPERLAQGYAPVDAGLVPEPFTGSGAFSPMGGLLSTGRDVATWVAGFQRSWAHTGADEHPLDRWSRREMQEPQRYVSTVLTPVADADPSVVSTSYGFGLVVDDDLRLGRTVSHSGGYPGFGSHMRWHPATGWGVVVLANRTYAPAFRLGTDLLAQIVGAQLDEGFVAPSRAWARTLEAMEVAERLLDAWDDDLADGWFAVNVDLDRPRAERRTAFAQARAQLGGVTRDAASVVSASPSRARWHVSGPGGGATLEVLLTPEAVPRIQTLVVTPDPAA